MKSAIKVIKFLSTIKPLLGRHTSSDLEIIRAQSRTFRKTLEELGPMYIKLGQILSLRYDFLHKETCKELQELLDSENQVLSYDTVKTIIKQEVGDVHYSKIRSIEVDPLSVASLGQVHLATLENDEKVAIKVQKPGIREVISSDLKILYIMLRLGGIFPSIKKLRIERVLKEFEMWTMRELDYTVEATNTEKFGEYFKTDPDIRSPRVYRELTSDIVLTTEFIDGVSAKEFLAAFGNTSDESVMIRGITFNRHKAIEIFKRAIYKQAFADGFIHGDPHPANILISKKQEVVYIDFGIVAQINSTQLKMFHEIVGAIAEGNRKAFVESLLRVDQERGSLGSEEILKILDPLFDKLEGSLSEEYSPTQFVLDVIYNAGKMDIQIPPFLVILGKVLAVYDGLLQVLDPKASLLNEIAPLFEQDQLFSLTKPEKLKESFKEVIATSGDILTLFKSLPRESLGLLEELRVNGLKVNLDQPTANMSQAKHQSNLLVMMGLFMGAIFMFFTVSNSAFNVDINGIALSWLLLLNWCIISTVILIYIIKS